MTRRKTEEKAIDKPGFEARRQRGRSNEGACLPVQPPAGEMPASCGKLLADLKQRIASRRLRIVMSANAEMIMLYWEIGKSILKRQDAEGWGAKVIDRLSADLRETLAHGWSQPILCMQIESGLYERQGKVVHNFAETIKDEWKRLRNFIKYVESTAWGKP